LFKAHCLALFNEGMDKHICVICPTRGRPKQCLEMVDSFLATSKMSRLKIYLDMDDPCLYEYLDLVSGKVPCVIDQRKTITQIINEAQGFAPECFGWFSVTNDDFVYKTDAWDVKLVGEIQLHGGIGIAYGNDLLQGVNMPTTSVVSREIVQALGWLQMPRLTHLFGDNVWKAIGQAAGCLHYRPDVIIEHKHYFGHKAQQDDIYKNTNSRAMYDKDGLAFHFWSTQEGIEDIRKVKNLLQKPAIA